MSGLLLLCRARSHLPDRCVARWPRPKRINLSWAGPHRCNAYVKEQGFACRCSPRWWFQSRKPPLGLAPVMHLAMFRAFGTNTAGCKLRHASGRKPVYEYRAQPGKDDKRRVSVKRFHDNVKDLVSSSRG